MADKGKEMVTDSSKNAGDNNSESLTVYDIIDTTGGNTRFSKKVFNQRYKKAFEIFQRIQSHTGLLHTRLETVDIMMAMADSEGPPLEEKILPTELERDLQLGLHLVQISFLLNHFIPRRHVNRLLFMWLTKKLQDTVREVYSDTPDLCPELAGSIPEGFAVPHHFLRKEFDKGLPSPHVVSLELASSDSDIVIVATSKKVGFVEQTMGVNLVMETDHTYPGYCRIVYLDHSQGSPDYKAQKPGTDKYYLKSEKIMTDIITSVKLQAQINIDMQGSQITRHGPALTEEPQEKFKNYLLDNDFVFAMPVIAWPTEAAKWRDRRPRYDWPAQALKEKLISEGCLVVAAPHHTSTWRDVEWRISFSRAERALAESLDDIQHQCYILLKVLVKYILNPIKSITSYHLKTLLFWTCEKLPKDAFQDKEEGLARCFLLLLDELLHAIIKHNLPHYFFTCNNLFSHIHPDFMVDIGKRVSWLRSNLTQVIFDFDKEFVFRFSPRVFTLETLLGPLLVEAKEPYKDVKRAYAAQAHILQPFAKSLLLNANIDDMIETCREVCHIRHKVIGEDTDFRALAIKTAMIGPDEYLLITFEQLMRRFPSSNNMCMLQGNAAGVYHNMAYKDEKRATRKLLLDRAEKLYSLAVTNENATGATWADYATFCLKEGRIEEAIKAAANAKEQGAGLTNYFSRKEIHTVPDCLQRDIELDKDLIISTTVYATFLLALCKLQKNLKDDAESYLSELQQQLSSTESERQESASFKILGYGWIAVENYPKAMKAFEEALNLKPLSDAAVEGKTLCEAFALSLQ